MDVLRRFSANNNLKTEKNESRVQDGFRKEEFPNSVSFDRKKIQANISNPPLLTNPSR